MRGNAGRQQLVSASEDTTLKVWEPGSGRAVATLQGHTDGVTACAVTPDGRHVVSASRRRRTGRSKSGSPRAAKFFRRHFRRLQRNVGSGRDRLLGRRVLAAAGRAPGRQRRRRDRRATHRAGPGRGRPHAHRRRVGPVRAHRAAVPSSVVSAIGEAVGCAISPSPLQQVAGSRSANPKICVGGTFDPRSSVAESPRLGPAVCWLKVVAG